jgi:hypothetical protein
VADGGRGAHRGGAADRAAHRGRVPGWWIIPVLEILLLATLIGQDPGHHITRLSNDFRSTTVALVAVMTTGTLLAAVILIYDIFAGNTSVRAADLLGRGAAIWLTNIIVFSIWFWELDRGGPVRRAHHRSVPPSFASRERHARASSAGLDTAIPRLPVPLVHQRDRVQPDGDTAGADVGEGDDDAGVHHLAGACRSRCRARHQRAARVRRPADRWLRK